MGIIDRSTVELLYDLTCATCGQVRSAVRPETFVCRYCLSTEHVRPYGFQVFYEARISMLSCDERSFRSKGSESTAVRRAKYKSGCIRVVRLEPFTHEQWLRCFGERRM
jgi:hypothetical protein